MPCYQFGTDTVRYSGGNMLASPMMTKRLPGPPARRHVKCLQALLAVSVLIGLAGCASNPQSVARAAYDDYWRCASTAVRPYIDQRQLSSHEVAMRAQAKCNAAYQHYRSTQIGVVRDTVAADSYDLADQLGAQQALVWRRRVTRTLDDYVRRVRSGA